jgi:hypothetical protein
MTVDERAEWFTYFTVEEFLASQAERERLDGVPANHKCTDPMALAKVAKLMVGARRAA